MKYDLVGVDGNTFSSIMGYVFNAMKECKIPKGEQLYYYIKATSGDYENLLAISIEMIDKCNEIAEEF